MAKIAVVDVDCAAFEYNFGAISSLLIDHGHEVMAFYDGPGGPRDKRVRFERCPWTSAGIAPIARFDPYKVLVFNGSHPHRYAATRLMESKWPVVYAENGWLPQDHNIYLDPEGVNSRSSIYKNPYLPFRSDSYLAAIEKTYQKLKVVFRPGPPPKGLPENYILVPLQLERDTSITLDSPYFKSIDAFVRFVRWHFCDHPIVIKPHPKDLTPWKYDGLHVVDKSVKMNDLVPRARLVIGINSTSLIEALVHHKPVVAVGTNVASDKGAYVADSKEMLFGNPRECLSRKPDTIRINEVLYFLSYHQFQRKNPPASILKLFE